MPDSYVKISDGDGFVTCPIAEEPRVDAAVQAWLDSGGTRDSLIMLEMADGDIYKVRASHIKWWIISTPMGRKNQLDLQRQAKEEEQAVLRELGMWDEGNGGV